MREIPFFFLCAHIWPCLAASIGRAEATLIVERKELEVVNALLAKVGGRHVYRYTVTKQSDPGMTVCVPVHCDQTVRHGYVCRYPVIKQLDHTGPFIIRHTQ